MVQEFNSLSELMEAFTDPQAAIDYFTAIRWKDGQFCPYCGNSKLYKIKNTNRWKCAAPECFNSFSITVGTIFENTKLPLKVWFGAMWLITNHKKGIASTTLARDLNITQKAAWFVLHRLRYAASTKSFNAPLSGVVEVDETFVGGKAKNRHKKNRDGNPGPTASGKTVVAGAMQRDGQAAARVIKNVRAETLTGFVGETVSTDAEMVVTDQWIGYRNLGKDYAHVVVNHAKGKFVDGDAHTQGIEGVWSLLKRQIIGIHHHVSPKHLDQYVGEMTWRVNRRHMTPADRVKDLCANVDGRLTYKQLTS